MYTLLVTGDVPGASTYFNPMLQQTIIPCTSGARPSSPTDGMTVFETDTRFFRSYNSTDATWYIVGTNRKLWVRKPADTTRTSNATASADPDLLLTNVPASTYYRLQAMIAYSADTAADMRAGLYGPSGATYKGQYQGAPLTVTGSPSTLSLDATVLGSGFGFGGIGSGTDIYAMFDGTYYSGVGGTMGFTWAQYVSNAIGTTVRTDSYLKLEPLG
jgi:hypothetical protein